MRHAKPTAADLAPHGAILALVSELTASTLLEASFPGLSAALNRAYGKQGWFLCWDEDLGGHPIKGTLTVAYGKETLVVG
ncbi:MAG TPA: hypothetical protein PK286_07810 [Devosia sp.]|nr:hypothetical protein [Devosia sp.]